MLAISPLGFGPFPLTSAERGLNARTTLESRFFRGAGCYDCIGLGPNGFRSALLFDLLADEWRAARR
jgi:hypothetical protein